MNKRLFALAVAGAFAAPVAMAGSGSVTVYGQLNAAFTNVNSDKTAAAAEGTSSSHISSESSRIGFKGTEDLGGGLSAIWQIENAINMDNNSGSTASFWNTRNTFVGLSSESCGSVVLGNNDSTYKTVFRGFDAFADTIADNRSIIGSVDGAANSLDARNSSSVTYTSSDRSGLKVMAQYVAGAETATTSTQRKGNSYNLAGAYNAGPVTAAAAYTQMKAGATGTGTSAFDTGLLAAAGATGADDKLKGFRIGGGYKVGALSVNALYEKNKVEIPTGLVKFTAFYVSGKYAVNGSDTLKVAYSNADDWESAGTETPQTGASQWALGYDHAMSKRTTIYALYTKLDNDNSQNKRLGPVTTTAGTGAVGNGASPSAFALGIKHSF